MTTLHKFKLLASQCAVVAGSPTQSPTTSPVIHLRRRKTLRMLLSRSSHDHRRRLPRRDDLPPKDPPQKKRVRKKLKDLFVSSPPFEDKGEHHDPDVDRDEEDLLPDAGRGSTGGSGPRIGGLTTRRPISVDAIALYSASEELLDIVFCFFDFQLIKASPWKTQQHVIDFLF